MQNNNNNNNNDINNIKKLEGGISENAYIGDTGLITDYRNHPIKSLLTTAARFPQEAGEMGTGLITLGSAVGQLATNPTQAFNLGVQALPAIGEYVSNTVKPENRIVNIQPNNYLDVDTATALNYGVNAVLSVPRDTTEFLFSNWGVTPQNRQRFAQDLQTKGLTPAVGGYLERMVNTVGQHPVSGILDLFGAKGLTKAASKTTSLADIGKASTKLSDLTKSLGFGTDIVEGAKQIENAFTILNKYRGASKVADVKFAKISGEVSRLGDIMSELAKDPLLPKAIKAAEGTIAWSSDIRHLKPVLQKFSKDWDNAVKKFAPYNAVDSKDLSVAQGLARATGKSFQEMYNKLDDIKAAVNNKIGDSTSSLAEFFNFDTRKGANNIVKNLNEMLNKIGIKDATVKLNFKTEAEGAEKFGEATRVDLNKTVGEQKNLKAALKTILKDKEEIKAVESMTAGDCIKALSEAFGMEEKQIRNALADSGKVDNFVNTVKNEKINIDSTASYNEITNTITIKEGADAATVIHEVTHALASNIDKAAKLGNKKAATLVNQIKKLTGVNDIVSPEATEKLAYAAAEMFSTGKSSIPEADKLFKGLTKNLTKEQELTEAEKLAPEAKRLMDEYDRGNVFPITHAGTNPATLSGDVDTSLINYAGKFTNRAYGSATAEEIAKSYKDNAKYLDDISQQYLESRTSADLLKGKLGDINVAPTNVKDTRYISRADLEAGKVIKAVSNAKNDTKFAGNPDYIPIDKYYVSAIKDTILPFGSGLTGLAGDLYKVQKARMLAGGTYVGANLMGGIANTLLHSNVGVVDDFIKAIGTKGQLAKNLGVYRRPSDISKGISNPVFKGVANVNKYTTGSVANLIDTKAQNLFSEMAAHANLRKQGVAATDRLKQVESMDAMKLSDLITDVKRTAIINDRTTGILPRGLAEFGALYKPFIRWDISAMQSAYHQIKTQPVLANLVVNHILSNIGQDLEMQNRLNLGVQSDKPFVTYKFDPVTGRTLESTQEFTPLVHSLKLIGDPYKFAANETTGQALLADTFNALKGKDRYGRPLRRAVKTYDRVTQLYDDRMGTRKFQRMDNGEWVKVNQPMYDEVVSTLVKELVAAPTMLNQTALPIYGAMTNKPYYQPYAQSILGDFTANELDNTMLMGGDPRKPVQPRQVLNRFLGIYETPYYPERPTPISPSEFTSGKRAIINEMLKKEGTDRYGRRRY